MHNYSKIGGSSDFASRYPTRILVGYWLYSSEPEPDQHAVYGILSRDGKLRFKLVSETRAGRIIRGNYPPPSETWLIHEEIVLLPHLHDLNRLGMKEYCRERGRQIAAAGGEEESPEQADENDRKAVEYAVRVSTVPDGQRPRNLRWEREKCADRQRAMRKLGTASAHAKAMHEKANGIAPSSPPSDLDLDRYRAGPVLKPVPPPQHRPSSSVSSSVSASRKRRSVSPPADEPAPMDRDPYKPPSPRAQGHRLPDTRPPPSPSSPNSFRAANARMDQQPQQHHPADRLPPIQSFHAAANGHDDKDQQQQRLPPLHATLAADAMDLDDKERLPPIQSLTSTAAAAVSAVAIAPKPARQPLPQHPYGSPPAPRKALPTSAAHRKSASSASTERSIVVASPPTPTDDDLGPRSQVFNGMTYVRKSRGSFKGKLVSPGKIITIEGQDYVEYCVLAKLSFV